jgi:hypothetical protein
MHHNDCVNAIMTFIFDLALRLFRRIIHLVCLKQFKSKNVVGHRSNVLSGLVICSKPLVVTWVVLLLSSPNHLTC